MEKDLTAIGWEILETARNELYINLPYLDAALFAVTRRARVSLRPDFAAASAHAELSGMISLRVGHIMLAALLGAWEYGLGRLKTWKSIPSKAS